MNSLFTLAARHALPAIYPVRSFADLGGLMSYGGQFIAAKPAGGDLHRKNFEGRQATLTSQSNRAPRSRTGGQSKTANALGLKIPVLMLAADEVIEYKFVCCAA